MGNVLTKTSLSEIDGRFRLDDLLPQQRAFVPVARRRLVARPSRLVDILGAVHSAHHAPVVVALDAAVVLVVAALLGAGPWALGLLPLGFAVAAYVAHVYTPRDTVQTRGVLWYPARIVAPLSVVALMLTGTGVLALGDAAMFTIGVITALTALRVLTWTVLVLVRRKGFGLRRTLIVGDGDQAATVWRRLVEFPEAGLLPVQLLTYESAHVPGAVERALESYAVRHVVLVAPGPAEALITADLPRQHTRAPFFSAVPPLAELYLDPRSVSEVGGIPLIPLGRVTHARRSFPGKRVMDVVAASLMSLALLPLAAIVAVAVRLEDRGPVFYRQNRVGRDGQLFGMLKFRTMVVGADQMLALLAASNESDGLLFKMKADPRITRVGRFLRKTSLDELPQVWNVLTGTMSLVGPRPLPVQADAFAPMEAERHTVLPGITGYWQLSGGPELSYAEMIRLDLSYIRNWSLWLDVRLLLRTVPCMLHRHGAS